MVAVSLPRAVNSNPRLHPRGGAGVAAAAVPVLALRADPTAATASRVGVAAVLYVAAAIVWIRRRDAWGLAVRGFFARGRAAP